MLFYTSIWDLMDDIRQYESLSDNNKNKILGEMDEDSLVKNYNYPWLLNTLTPKLKDDKAFYYFKKYINSSSSINQSYFFCIIEDIIGRTTLCDKLKELLESCERKTVQKMLLCISEIDEEQEIKGLRALNLSRYIPSLLYKIRYKPSKSALKQLPPIMRLNVLECLVEDYDLGYNVLENFNDADEFKSLLFGAVLRHRERVEEVTRRYDELRTFGQPKTFNIKVNCDVCGDINISVTTIKVKNERRLARTAFDRFIHGVCPLCNKYVNSKAIFSWDEND